MHTFDVGKCKSSAGLIDTVGIGWNPSSLAGREGEPVPADDDVQQHQLGQTEEAAFIDAVSSAGIVVFVCVKPSRCIKMAPVGRP